MKPQSKRFIVEVRRGTNRSAFLSADVAPDKFSSAEMALFGAPPQSAAQTRGSEPQRPQGRVLRSLIEPPPPAIEEPEPVRRGRKPGSKNKPKPDPASRPETAVLPSIEALSVEARAFAERPSLRFSPTPDAGRAEAMDAEAEPPVAAPIPHRPRLRQRSKIIRRYVLGIEPSPGQVGYRKAKRTAKSGH